MIFGQPPDTASMSVEGSRSLWMIKSLTAASMAYGSIVHSGPPSALISGLV